MSNLKELNKWMWMCVPGCFAAKIKTIDANCFHHSDPEIRVVLVLTNENSNKFIELSYDWLRTEMPVELTLSDPRRRLISLVKFMEFSPDDLFAVELGWARPAADDEFPRNTLKMQMNTLMRAMNFVPSYNSNMEVELLLDVRASSGVFSSVTDRQMMAELVSYIPSMMQINEHPIKTFDLPRRKL